MSTQVTNNVGDFSKPVASPYAESLGELLNMIYNDAKLQIQNRDVQKEIADAQGKAAKAEGQAQENAGKEEADKMRYEGYGTMVMGGFQMGTLGSIFLSSRLAKSERFSARGDEIRDLKTQTKNCETWENALKKEPNVELGNNARNQQQIEARLERFEEVRAKFKDGKAFDAEDQDVLEAAKIRKSEEYRTLQKEVQEKKSELEVSKKKAISDAYHSQYMQTVYLIQGMGQAIQGLLSGHYAASHAAAAAEQQNLQTQMDYAFKRFESAQQSLEKQSNDLDAAKQNLSQLLGTISRVSSAA